MQLSKTFCFLQYKHAGLESANHGTDDKLELPRLPRYVVVAVKFMNGKAMMMEAMWAYIQQIKVRKDR